MTRHRRTGIGLVEILVAVSLVSVLLALLLPAVQRVRAAADRVACQSNLRQLGLAAQHFETTLSQLPPAFRRPGAQTSEPYLQWPILIAPFLELDACRRMAAEDFKASRDPFLPAPHRGLSQALKPFACPSDPRTSSAWQVTFMYTLAVPRPTLVTQRVALNSYLGNAGEKSRRRDGVIVADGGVRLLDVVDGTSNTLAFGERPPPADLLHGWLYIGWGVNRLGALDSVIGVKDLNPNFVATATSTCGPGPFPFQQPVLNARPDCAVFQYWSLHTGGANFTFCDGSVRFLAYAADSVLGALATRAGGEAAAPPE